MGALQFNPSRVFKIALLHLLFWILVVTYFAWGFGLDVNPKSRL